MCKNLTIGSMNVRGLANKQKRFDVFQLLKRKKNTIYCLQEVNVDYKIILAHELDWDGKIIYSSVSSAARG